MGIASYIGCGLSGVDAPLLLLGTVFWRIEIPFDKIDTATMISYFASLVHQRQEKKS